MEGDGSQSDNPLLALAEDLRLRINDANMTYCLQVHRSLPGVEQYQDPSDRWDNFVTMVKPMTSLPNPTEILASSTPEKLSISLWQDINQLKHLLAGSHEVGWSILKTFVITTDVELSGSARNIVCDDYTRPELELYLAIQNDILPRLNNLILLLKQQFAVVPELKELVNTELTTDNQSIDVRYYTVVAMDYAKKQAEATKAILEL